MLRTNLCTEKGLVNGSLGTIIEIVYRPGKRPPFLPFVIFVKFVKYGGPYYGDPDDKLFPLMPTKVTWRDGGTDCERRNFR